MAHKYESRNKMFFNVGIGVVISIMITITLAAITALLITNERLPISSMQYATIFIWFFSALIGGLVTGKATAEKKLIASLATCGVYIFLMFSMAITLFDGLGQAVWIGIISAIIGSCCAIIIAQKPKSRTRRLKKMRISR